MLTVPYKLSYYYYYYYNYYYPGDPVQFISKIRFRILTQSIFQHYSWVT